jgi:hypothetical protein
MAGSAFAVIEKYQSLLQPPVRAGGELKVIEAARAVRRVNANATLIFYFAVDYARLWYDLGRYFDEHAYLEVHDADGWRANHSDSDGGAPNTWGIFDWAQEEARSAWVDRLASVVSTSDDNGNNLFSGVFIDGYRAASGWASGLIPKATAAEQAAWLAGATLLGPQLAEALGNDTIRFINPGQVFSEFPGYNANSIEFFAPEDSSIEFLQSIIGQFPTIEVHAYISDNLGLFNLTFAAYLIAVGPGAFFGAGADWSTCDGWRELVAEEGRTLPPPPHAHTLFCAQSSPTLSTRSCWGRLMLWPPTMAACGPGASAAAPPRSCWTLEAPRRPAHQRRLAPGALQAQSSSSTWCLPMPP